jgi:hypothetical protein
MFESRIGPQLHKYLLGDKLREQVMFHVHDDYATQQAENFGVGKRVTD